MKIFYYILGVLVLQVYAKDSATNIFDATYYEGTYYNGNISIPPIGTNHYSELNITLTGDFQQYFTTERTDNETIISSKEPIPYHKIQNITHFIMTLNAYKNDDKLAWATIVTTVEKDVIEFYPSEYYANITTAFRGVLFDVGAEVDSNQTIYYKLDLQNDSLNRTLKISANGVIRVNLGLPPGHYVFYVIASTYTTSNYAPIIIDVYKKYDHQPLLITSIMEHDTSDDILKEEQKSCLYEITDSWPYPQTWFQINDNKLSTSGVDRENETIAFMTVSQVQIELTCMYNIIDTKQPEYSMIDFANHRSMESPSCDLNKTDKHWIYTKDIVYSPYKRLISIIVEDINDHSPEFHTDNPLVVGYPDKDLIDFIRPQSLVTVHATDKDICLNAKIKYSTDNNAFAIHPETGVVYPAENALTFLNDDFYVTITATDQDGHGRSTNQYIQVKLLSPMHIVVIPMKYYVIEDVPDIIQQISSLLFGVSVKCIESFMSPIDVSDERNAYESMGRYENLNTTTTLIMFIYGITEEGRVLDAEELKNIIREDDPWIFDTSTLLESDFYNNDDRVVIISKDGGLIAGVTLLSISLFIVLVLAFVWYFIIMPTKYQRIETLAFQTR